MSTNLYWRPTPKPTRERTLPLDLKYRLSQRYFGHDGTLRSDPITLGHGDVPYLQGLADGGVDGADALIGSIEKHEAVDLWIDE